MDDKPHADDDRSPAHEHAPSEGGVKQGPVEVITAEDFARRSIDLTSARDAAGRDPEPTVETRTPRRPRLRLPEIPAGEASKADVRLRALARLIDTGIFVLLAESIGFVGPLAALAYLLLGDGLLDGASIGKKLMGLHTHRNRDDKAGNIFDSLLRNAPFGIAGIFVLIPLIGWALFLTLGLAVVLFESYMVWHDPCGVRAGDILAGTQVREGRATHGPTSLPDNDATVKSARELGATPITATPSGAASSDTKKGAGDTNADASSDPDGEIS